LAYGSLKLAAAIGLAWVSPMLIFNAIDYEIPWPKLISLWLILVAPAAIVAISNYLISRAKRRKICYGEIVDYSGTAIQKWRGR
jgi:hypothetical protein